MNVDSVEIDGPAGRAAVVRLAGLLTFDTAPAAREHLLKAVASQPSVVVADVAELFVQDDVALTLFPSIARHAAAWPGIPLVLAAPGPDLAAALERTAAARYVPVASSVEDACAAVDGTPPRRLVEWTLASPQAVSLARAMARSACERWGHPGLAEVAELVMSELVSNAIRHAGGMIEIGVALRLRHLHLAVRDRSTDPPRIGRGDGRGLMLIEAMASGWGSNDLSDGKVVWATLRVS